MPLKLAYAVLAAALSISVGPLVDCDVLEPSVENEVVFAIARAPTNHIECAVSREDVEKVLLGTNSLNSTEMAIRLVSAQKSDGRWLSGANDVTAVAVEMLESLL